MKFNDLNLLICVLFLGFKKKLKQDNMSKVQRKGDVLGGRRSGGKSSLRKRACPSSSAAFGKKRVDEGRKWRKLYLQLGFVKKVIKVFFFLSFC